MQYESIAPQPPRQFRRILVPNPVPDWYCRILDKIVDVDQTDTLEQRDWVTHTLGWGWPTAESMLEMTSVIATFRKDACVRGLSIGAGNAFIEQALEEMNPNIDIIKTDVFADTSGRVLKMTAVAAADMYKDDVDFLFVSWPSVAAHMAYQAVSIGQFQHVIYIGEGVSGTESDVDFHRLLSANYEPVCDLSCKQWPGVGDRVNVHRRSQLSQHVLGV